MLLRSVWLALKGVLAGTIKGITVTSLNRSDVEDLNGAAGGNHQEIRTMFRHNKHNNSCSVYLSGLFFLNRWRSGWPPGSLVKQLRNVHVFIGYKESKPTFSNIFSALWGTLCVLISTVYIVYSTGMLLFVFSSPLWMPPAGRRAGGAELYLLSDLTYFAVRHPSLPPPWQFSLGCEFNIVKNRICIYISFFIWSGQLWKTCLFLAEISCNQFSCRKLYLGNVKMYIDQ